MSVKLSKADARRGMVRWHFDTFPTPEEAFGRLRSVQVDPIAPIGCNHDLVLQARVPAYRVGGWEKLAYEDRFVYDGWDKMASLVPFEGWPLRRVFFELYRRRNPRVFEEHPDAMEAVLKELEERGPMMPREFSFQRKQESPKGSWRSPNVTKQALRALWHTGQVMTTGRRNGQHLYDLTERVLPPHLSTIPLLPEVDAMRELILERHRAVGLLRPGAPYEVWSYSIYVPERKVGIDRLVSEGKLVPVEVEGVKAHATPEFLEILDQPSLDPEVTFVGPLDPFMWDRKMILHLFGFDYVWEIYVPEAKRRWGYYVLPIRFGDALVARTELFCRDGAIEIRKWHTEGEGLPAGFLDALAPALERLKKYAGAPEIRVAPGVESPIKEFVGR
jgi:uncharacterized protein YcaQ